MTDITRDNLDLRDEDRLPWLESVEDDRIEEMRISPVKLAAVVIGILVALALMIAAFLWMRARNAAPIGTGEVIAAPAGPYKVKPDEPGGMAVEGEGDASFAASEGAEARGRIDTNAVPETPVMGSRAAPTPAAPVATGSAKVADAGKMPAPAARAVPARVSAAVAAGSVVQVGAYNSAAIADEAWTRMSKRFSYLAPLTKIVVPVKVGNTTLYRLRADTGSSPAAKELCGKLKVAGENCLIAVN